MRETHFSFWNVLEVKKLDDRKKIYIFAALACV